MHDRIEQYRSLVAGLDRAVVLFAMQHVGVFRGLLHGPRTVEALAAETSTHVGVLSAFADLAVALGVLSRSGAEYSLVSGDEAIFDPDNPTFNLLESPPLSSWLPRWEQFAYALRSGPLLSGTETIRLDEPQKRDFMTSLDARSQAAAAEVAGILAALAPTRIADVGSGLGTYAFALLQHCGEAQATLVDQVLAERAVLERAVALAVRDRVTFCGVDILAGDYGSGYDLIVISNVLHDYDAARSHALLRNAAARLRPGGWLAIKDIDIEEERRGPLAALDFRASVAVFTGGDIWSEGTVRSWLVDVGMLWRQTCALRQDRGAYLILAQAPGTPA